MGRLGRILWKIRLEQGPERQVRLTSRRWSECERRLPALFCMLFWHTGVVANYPNFKGLSACKVNKRNCHIPEIKSKLFPPNFKTHMFPSCLLLPPRFLLFPPLTAATLCVPSSSSCQDLLLMFSLCLEDKAGPLPRLQCYPQCLAHSSSSINICSK